MDSSQFKQLIKEKFDARTEYDKDNNRHPKLAVDLVHRAHLQPGWSVLDLACGTGFVTFLAAEKVGASGAVAGVDLSSVMIQQAVHKLELSGLTNVCFEIGDLEDCSFPDDFFDAILCSQAMFYIDLKSVSKMLHGWLRPGGILAYNTHQVAVRMTHESMQEPYTPLLPLMGSLLNEASANVGYSTYSPDKPLSQTHSEQANVQILQDAGFCNIQVEKTEGLLFEQPVSLEDYVHNGFQLVTVGFRPFFPALDLLMVAELSAVQQQFCAEASVIGQRMLNAAGLVEDKHTDLWVVAVAASSKTQ